MFNRNLTKVQTLCRFKSYVTWLFGLPFRYNRADKSISFNTNYLLKEEIKKNNIKTDGRN